MRASLIVVSVLLVCVVAKKEWPIQSIGVEIKKRLENVGPSKLMLDDYLDARGYIMSMYTSTDDANFKLKPRVALEGTFKSAVDRRFYRLATVGDTTIAQHSGSDSGILSVLKPLQNYNGTYATKFPLETFGFAPTPTGKGDYHLLVASSLTAKNTLYFFVLSGAKEQASYTFQNVEYFSYPNITVVPLSIPDKDSFMVFLMNPVKKQLTYFSLTYTFRSQGSIFEVGTEAKIFGITAFSVVAPPAAKEIYMVQLLETSLDALKVIAVDKTTGQIKGEENIRVSSSGQGIKSMIAREHSNKDFYIFTDTSNNTLVEYLVNPLEIAKATEYIYYKRENRTVSNLDGNGQNLVLTLTGGQPDEQLIVFYNRKYMASNGTSDPIWAMNKTDASAPFTMATSENNVSYFQLASETSSSEPLEFYKISPMELNLLANAADLRDRAIVFQATSGQRPLITIGNLLDYKMDDERKLNWWYWVLILSLLVLLAILIIAGATWFYRRRKDGQVPDHDAVNGSYSHANTGI